MFRKGEGNVKNSQVISWQPGSPEGEITTYWMSWKDGRIACGYGNTSGINLTALWDDPLPSPINRMMLKSDQDTTWFIPNRHYIKGI